MYCSISCSELWRKSIRVTLPDSQKLHYRLSLVRVRMRTFSPSDNETFLLCIRTSTERRKTDHENPGARTSSHQHTFMYVNFDCADVSRSKTARRNERLATGATGSGNRDAQDRYEPGHCSGHRQLAHGHLHC